MADKQEYASSDKIIKDKETAERKQNDKTENVCESIIDAILYALCLLLHFILAFNLQQSNTEKTSRCYLLYLQPWIPGLVLVPHEIYYNTDMFATSNNLFKIFQGLTYIALYPVIIIVNLFKNMIASGRMKIARLNSIHCLNEIILGSLNMVLVIFLVIRGDIILGGNIACYLGTASLLISAIIYLKGCLAMLEHNYKFSRINPLPWLMSTMLFRMTAYAYILTFLDIWSIIPLAGLTLVLVALYGWSSLEEEDQNEESQLKSPAGSKGPYAMIWTGQKWVKKYVNEQYNKEEESNKVSCVLKGFVRIFSPIFGRNDKCKATRQLFLENLAISIIIFFVFILVNNTISFQYEPNILNNDNFVKLSLILVCFGIMSTLFLTLQVNRCNNFVQCTSTLFQFALAIFTPIAIINFPTTSTIMYKYYLFSVNNNSNVEILAHTFTNQNHLAKTFESSEIYWDMSCNDEIEDKSLVIMNISDPACINKKRNINSTILVSANLKHRVSSPFYFEINFLYSHESIDVSFKRIRENLYIGNLSFVLSTVAEKSNCSSSKKIELRRNDDKCYNHKFINDSSGFIYEQYCTRIDGVVHAVNIFCNARYDSSFKPVLNGIVQTPAILSTDNNGNNLTSCCLNQTFYLQYFGSCESGIFSQIEKTKFSEHSECFNNYIMNNIGHFFGNKCLIKLSFFSKCYNSSIKHTCSEFKCNDLTPLPIHIQ